MDLNVKGIFFLTKAVLPLLDKAATADDPARIINIGSIAGIRPQVRGFSERTDSPLSLAPASLAAIGFCGDRVTSFIRAVHCRV